MRTKTLAALLLLGGTAGAAEAPWSVRMADAELARHPDPRTLDSTAPKWEYTHGLTLKGIAAVGDRTKDEKYWKYVLSYYDQMIDADGKIATYDVSEYNIDRINPGKLLFAVYKKTGDAKYKKALDQLRQQMRDHPRTSDGGFWHKKRYPYQMWLDGLYMGSPFLAQYAQEFDEPALFDDVVKQFVLMEKHARDEKTGLLYHGWDESRVQKWADKTTGRSPAFWGRAMGWYAMALVDALDFIPEKHAGRKDLVAILNRVAEAAVKVQDPKTGTWWQVLDQPGRDKNYLEASVTTMFAYALLKGSRQGHLEGKYFDAGRRAYEGALKEFVAVGADGRAEIHKVCAVAGLGGDPEKERYRSGEYDYYVNERIRSNDPKAVGPFILASLEIEGAKVAWRDVLDQRDAWYGVAGCGPPSRTTCCSSSATPAAGRRTWTWRHRSRATSGRASRPRSPPPTPRSTTGPPSRNCGSWHACRPRAGGRTSRPRSRAASRSYWLRSTRTAAGRSTSRCATTTRATSRSTTGRWSACCGCCATWLEAARRSGSCPRGAVSPRAGRTRAAWISCWPPRCASTAPSPPGARNTTR